jgi:hypothetical protein
MEAVMLTGTLGGVKRLKRTVEVMWEPPTEVKFIHVKETKKLGKRILISLKNLTRLIEEGKPPFQNT